jgi:hypothetical protein
VAGKITGKGQFLTLNGTRVNVTKITPKVDRKMADTTDSANYDATSDMLQQSQVAVKVGTTLAVEGWFYDNATNAALVTYVYSGGGPVPVVANISATVIFGHGNFDITSFECDQPIDDTVGVKFELMSSGVFTPGS